MVQWGTGALAKAMAMSSDSLGPLAGLLGAVCGAGICAMSHHFWGERGGGLNGARSGAVIGLLPGALVGALIRTWVQPGQLPNAYGVLWGVLLGASLATTVKVDKAAVQERQLLAPLLGAKLGYVMETSFSYALLGGGVVHILVTVSEANMFSALAALLLCVLASGGALLGLFPFDEKARDVIRSLYLLSDGTGAGAVRNDKLVERAGTSSLSNFKIDDHDSDVLEGPEESHFLWICHRANFSEKQFINEEIEKEDIDQLRDDLQERLHEKVEVLEELSLKQERELQHQVKTGIKTLEAKLDLLLNRDGHRFNDEESTAGD